MSPDSSTYLLFSYMYWIMTQYYIRIIIMSGSTNIVDVLMRNRIACITGTPFCSKWCVCYAHNHKTLTPYLVGFLWWTMRLDYYSSLLYYFTILLANNQGADQTAMMRKTICICVFCKWQKQVSSGLGSNEMKELLLYSLSGSTKLSKPRLTWQINKYPKRLNTNLSIFLQV